MIKPLRLKSGDRVGIISPSEPVTRKKNLRQGTKTLEEIGFRVALGRNVFEKYGIYMAGTDEQRASDLNRMFKDKKIKGVFCSIGGFSSNRLLDLIDYETIKKNPKVFMGFSDITVLLNAIHKKTGLVTFHGENVEYGFAKGLSGRYRYTGEYFKKAVMTGKPIGEVLPFSGSVKVLKQGEAEGALVGGNLSTLITLIGTEYEPEWEGKILFWEEFKQTPQDIDFRLTHLRQVGVFAKISGMVIGKLRECDFPYWLRKSEKTKGLSIRKIVLKICKDYEFPIIMNIPFGHVHPQIVLPIGVRAKIDTKESLPFSIVEKAVK